jgi:Fe-S-cluster containining protein
MKIDLIQIQRLGEQKFDENHRFRKFLKSRDSSDRRLRLIAEKIEEQIDCTECANCCRKATAKLTDRDIERLARYLRIKPAQFLKDYTRETEEEGLVLRHSSDSCVFLDGNLCTVYEVRPHVCQGFPHTVRGSGSIASRMWQFVDRASYCPIVYHTMEAWKVETKFR